MTFNPAHVDELISASLTGDLTDAERAEMDAHLARCDRCRATLAAFKSERRILSGLPTVNPPRDLSARVRIGVESGRLGTPWWRRRGGLIAPVASGTTVAAAVLAIIVFNNMQRGPVGQATSSPEATLSLAPSVSATESTAPSVGPSAPSTFLATGELGYLQLSGAPLEAPKLSFINDATGASIDAGTASGPPIAASLSPDGHWLAYITQLGETGANQVWVLRLADGTTRMLGCSEARAFTDRLAWSPDSSYLAYTIAAMNLGPSVACEAPTSPLGSTDAWIFSARTGTNEAVTAAGDVYTADFDPRDLNEGAFWLSLSHAAEKPWSEYRALTPDGLLTGEERLDGVFLPLMSPDGNRAIFWSGTMERRGGAGAWEFSAGGMPQISGDFRSAGPASPWLGTPLFTDLIPYGGEAFADGKFTWGPDSDLIAFWDGAWTGVPQSADGTYPSQHDAYAGRISTGFLTSGSRVPLDTRAGESIVDVAIRSDGGVAVTVRRPSAGIGDPPSAYLVIASLDSVGVDDGSVPPRWAGPAVFGH